MEKKFEDMNLGEKLNHNTQFFIDKIKKLESEITFLKARIVALERSSLLEITKAPKPRKNKNG